MNKIIILGRLVREPEEKLVASYKLAQFTIAQNKRIKDKDIGQFYDCKAWGKSCDVICQNGKKGDLILIEGRLEQETWEKKDGSKGSKHIINVNYFQFIGKQKEKSDPSEGIYPEPITFTEINDDPIF